MLLVMLHAFDGFIAVRANAQTERPTGCGELYMLLEVDTAAFAGQIPDLPGQKQADELSAVGIGATPFARRNGVLSFELENPARQAVAEQILKDMASQLQYGSVAVPGAIAGEILLYKAEFTAYWRKQFERAALESARRVIRNRLELPGCPEWHDQEHEGQWRTAVWAGGLREPEKTAGAIVLPARLGFHLEYIASSQAARDGPRLPEPAGSILRIEVSGKSRDISSI